METNEQGLTKEEKIMFGILGIILIVAVGVLIINSFSKNERKLEDSETPISETQGQKENTEDEKIINDQHENLIEEDYVEEVVITPVVNNSSSPKPTNTAVTRPKPEVEIETPTPVIPGLIEWSFKDTMVTEAYSNDTIIIDRNVILTDGSEVEAVVSLRKLELDSWNLIDISSNEIIVTEGLYKYYYTYGNQTKELLLTVKNKLQIEQLNILTINEEYVEDEKITEEEFNEYKSNSLNSTITNEFNNYTLTYKKCNEKQGIVPVIVTITEELIEPTITSSTLGVIPSTEKNTWYQDLTSKDIILWIDLSVLNINNKEINLNINGINYYFDLNIVITTETIPPTEEQPEQPTPEEDQDESSTEEQPTESEEEIQQPEKEQPSEEQPVEEENIQEENNNLDKQQPEETTETNENLETLSDNETNMPTSEIVMSE